MKTWEEILGFRQLTASYRAVPSLQNLFFTNTFYKAPKPIFGDKVRMVSIAATNTPGPMNSKGAAAKLIQPKGGSTLEFSLFHYFTVMPIDPFALMCLSSFDNPMLQEQGRDVLDLQIEESATKHRLAKEVILSSIMTYNAVDLDINGNILVPTVHATTGAITANASAALHETFNVPDDHRGNLGGIISAQWSTAGTDIALQLDNIDRQAAIDGAPKPMDIYVNAVHKTSLIANTKFNDMAKYANVANLMGQALNNIDTDTITVFGKRWHFISGTWVDSTGTTRDIMPQNLALMLPDGSDYLRPFTGRTPVPKSIDLIPGTQPLQNIQYVQGEYAYAATNHNPPGTELYEGDTWGMGFANPNAIWVPKVFS